MARSMFYLVVLTTMLVAGVLTTRVPAQQPAPLQAELLAEVRLLRQSIEALAGTNARVQIVFGRLQLQEQRTSKALDRLTAARQALVEHNSNASAIADQIKAMEAQAADSRVPEVAEQLRMQLTMIKRETERAEGERLRLQAEETEAASALNLEEGRWSDLNRQLEELERALTTRKQ